MVGAVIVTHGLLARELLDEAKRIVGRTKGICPFLSAGCWLCE
jgi:mannose/fructose-specific phosphotransferase system component IIA